MKMLQLTRVLHQKMPFTGSGQSLSQALSQAHLVLSVVVEGCSYVLA